MIIQSTRVFIASQFVKAQIEIEGNKIKGIYKYNEKPVDKAKRRKRIQKFHNYWNRRRGIKARRGYLQRRRKRRNPTSTCSKKGKKKII